MLRRDVVKAKHLETAKRLLEKELQRQLDKKGWGAFASPHETLGVVTEEYIEVQDEVRANNVPKLAQELCQLAVGALFGVASILAVDDDPDSE